MKKSLSFVLAMATVLSMLAGCGSASSSASQAAGSTSAASTASGTSEEDKY